MLSYEIRGYNSLVNKIDTIIRNLPAAAKQGTEDALKSTMAIAVRKAPGAVRNCIKVEILNADRQVITGRVFTDTTITSFAPYVEFGTGLKVDDQGNKEAIRLKRAKQVPWYIHVSMVPKSFEKYGYKKVTIAGEEYWECDGMYPHPYMHPAAFETRDENAQVIANALREMIVKVVH